MRGSVAFILAVLLSATHLQAEESPLVGKPLPALELSHALQGTPWSAEGLKGAVVVLDVFQLG